MRTFSKIGTALCLSAIGWTGVAHAAPCASLPNPLVISGSTAVQALVAKVAAPLGAASGADQLTVIYKGSGSCSGVTQLGLDATPTGACTAGGCITGTGTYWDATGTVTMCDLDPSGTHVDLILSDVYKESCEGVTNTKLRDEPVLVIPFGFIVPKASNQEAIDAREAYYVYGRGMMAGVSPWINETSLFRRDNGSGTQITIYKSIKIPVGSPIGVMASGTGDMITKVASAAMPEQTLGFAGLDAVDTKRAMVDILAYRHWGQTNFYWPDSSVTSFDKKNVRDGHYPLWGYEHVVTLVDDAGMPLKANAKKFADILSGKVALPGGNAILEEAKAGVVPLCAMDVARTADAGDFTLATSESCACFYEKNAGAAGGNTTCTACTADTMCTTGQKCRNGYCEAR
jgi:ABC-type phosphate transport system substrate-binding protein